LVVKIPRVKTEVRNTAGMAVGGEKNSKSNNTIIDRVESCI